ncbi:ABC transporter substrate-binding protein [Rhodococcus sp. ACT016]|uniref:ABC transporter substrate-binding protein n=1 Tax=Rhodococcus sp. ACT016 TaxID=3134808 RepID=UPI003D26FC71
MSIRRGAATLITVAIAAFSLAACGSDDRADAGTPTTAPESFPVTLTNAWGPVTITEKPDRVVTLGYADTALARALGANIVGAVASYGSLSGDSAGKNLPYVEPLGESTTWLDPVSINVEQIAGLDPDIILANAAFSLDEPMYQLLSGIAPVVTYEEGLYRTTAEDEAERIGRALGDEPAARELVARADAAISDLRNTLPGLAGRTYLYGQAREAQVVMVVDDSNLTARFMGRLGLVPLPAVAALPGPGSVPGTVDVSYERADLFDDADVLFMTFAGGAMKSQFESGPIVARLGIMKSNRYQPLGIEAATALQSPNVVAVPWLLDQLRPGLTAAAS